MTLVTYVPAPGYPTNEQGTVNAGGGQAFDVGAALQAGGGQFTVDSSVNGVLISVLDKYPGLVRSGTAPGPPVVTDTIGPVLAHSKGAATGDLLVRGTDGLFSPSQTLPVGQLPSPVETAVSTVRSVTGATAIPLPAASGGVFVDTLTGNVTYSAPATPIAGVGCTVTLDIYQDGTGGRTITWFAGITWLPGSAPSPATGPGTRLVVTLFSDDAGATWIGSYGGAASIEPWRVVGGAGQPAFQNSWVNSGAPNPLLSFAKTAIGEVLLQGLVLRPALAAGFVSSLIFTLPVGYRPATNLQRAVLVWNGSTFGSGQYLINSDGTVAWSWGGVAPVGNVSLDTSWRAEQ